jgi:hypothetical protein
VPAAQRREPSPEGVVFCERLPTIRFDEMLDEG